MLVFKSATSGLNKPDQSVVFNQSKADVKATDIIGRRMMTVSSHSSLDCRQEDDDVFVVHIPFSLGRGAQATDL